MPEQNPDPQHPRAQEPEHPHQQYGYMYAEQAPKGRLTATTSVLLVLLIATFLVGVCAAVLNTDSDSDLPKRGRGTVLTTPSTSPTG